VDSSDQERRQRAAARRAWPVRTYRLGDEPDDDLTSSTTPAERLSMMWPLAEACWRAAGRAIPDYSRANTPVRVLRAAGSSADE
jgi:hypothetical protein